MNGEGEEVIPQGDGRMNGVIRETERTLETKR